MAAPIVYRSSDASAPVLHGNAGDLITVLDACLVNGYGSKAAAGWTKSFSGTNAADYRQGGGNQFYLDVNDNNPNVTSTGKEAAIRGFEAMTALATGTSAFPTTAQIAAPGLRVRKSSVADNTTARTWLVVADDRTVYMFVLTGDTANQYNAWGFGDFFSFKSGDGFRTFITAGIAMNATFASGAGDLCNMTGLGVAQSGLYVARTSAGTGTSITASKLGLGVSNSGAATQPAATPAYPNTADSSLYLSRYPLAEVVASQMRGYIRGHYQVLNGITGSIVMTAGDTFSGTGDFAGRTFLVVGLDANGTGTHVIETTAWDTSS